MIKGVPVGAQIAWLLSTNSGIPFDNTRVVPVSHVAVMHGPFAAMGGGSAQPAITYGNGCWTVGCPLTNTRGFGEVGVACPPCAQSTVAPTCNKGPGMFALSLRPSPSRLRAASPFPYPRSG